MICKIVQLGAKISSCGDWVKTKQTRLSEVASSGKKTGEQTRPVHQENKAHHDGMNRPAKLFDLPFKLLGI
jgi:hypothetical protein